MYKVLIPVLLVAAALSGGSVSSAATSVTYTSLGDSISNPLAPNSYVLAYSNDVALDLSLPVTNTYLSFPGWNSAALLANVMVRQGDVAQANLVTMFTGFNDLYDARLLYLAGTCGGVDNQDCFRAAVAAFNQNFDALLLQISTLNSSATLRVLTVYNPYVAVDAGDPTFKLYVDAVNHHIRQSGAQVADVAVEFNGRYGTADPVARGFIGPDGIHPNATGHTVIANSLRAGKYAPLDGSVPITCVGDASRDRTVNSTDLLVVAKHQGFRRGTAGYFPDADANNDGYTNSTDYLVVARHYGSCTLP